jgi:hypothetical protein
MAMPTDVEVTKIEFSGTETEFTGTEAEFAGAKMEFTGTEAEFTEMKTDFTDIKTEIAEMKILVKETINYLEEKTGFSAANPEFPAIKTELPELDYFLASSEVPGHKTGFSESKMQHSDWVAPAAGAEATLIKMSAESKNMKRNILDAFCAAASDSRNGFNETALVVIFRQNLFNQGQI